MNTHLVISFNLEFITFPCISVVRDVIQGDKMQWDLYKTIHNGGQQ